MPIRMILCICILWTSSLFIECESRSPHHEVVMRSGSLYLHISTARILGPTSCRVGIALPTFVEIVGGDVFVEFRNWRNYAFCIPLWIPAGAVAIVLVAWQRQHRRRRWNCSSCGTTEQLGETCEQCGLAPVECAHCQYPSRPDATRCPECGIRRIQAGADRV